jgi:hypothetical protein
LGKGGRGLLVFAGWVLGELGAETVEWFLVWSDGRRGRAVSAAIILGTWAESQTDVVGRGWGEGDVMV